MNPLLTPVLERPAQGRAQGLVVLLHGVGSNEQSLAALASTLDPRLHVLCSFAAVTAFAPTIRRGSRLLRDRVQSSTHVGAPTSARSDCGLTAMTACAPLSSAHKTMLFGAKMAALAAETIDDT